MKKFIFILAVLLLAVPVLAANHSYTGLPLDANGFTDLPAMVQATSRIVYIADDGNNDTGAYYTTADEEVGSDPFQPDGAVMPYLTFDAAYAELRDGYPDILLWKRGDTFQVYSGGANDMNITKSGASNTSRFIIAAYGDPSTARPYFDCRIQPVRCGSNESHYIVANLRLVYDPDNGSDYLNDSGININHDGANVLIEDCTMEYFGKTCFRFQALSASGLTNVALRRSVIYNSWTSALYVENCLDALIEGNTLDLTGYRWRLLNSSSAAPQTIYLQYNNGNVICDNNILSRGSSTGIQLRGNGQANGNIIVTYPMGIQLGHDQQAAALTVESSSNIILDGVDMIQLGGTVIDSRGWGIWTDNISGFGFTSMTITDNIIAGNNSDTEVNNRGLRISGDITTGAVTDNIIYRWKKAALYIDDGHSQSGLTISGNVFDGGAGYYGAHSTTGTETDAVFANNDYYALLRMEGADVNYATWAGTINDTGGEVLANDTSLWNTGVGSAPTVAAYMTSIGGTATHEAWINLVMAQRYGSWNTAYTEEGISDYIKAGFGVSDDAGAPVISGILPTGDHQCIVETWPNTELTLQATTDENATCKYDTSDVAYDSMANTFGSTGSGSHSQAITFDCGKSFVYYIRCADVASNKNTVSGVATFSIDADPPPVRNVHVH